MYLRTSPGGRPAPAAECDNAHASFPAAIVYHLTLVTAQFALIIAIALHAHPDRLHPVAVVLAVVGCLLGIWTLIFNRPGNFNIRPAVKETAQLIVHGPYRFMRHPMYTSLIALMAGCALNGWPDAVAAYCLAALIVVLVLKMDEEEKLLKQRFPEYPVYMQRTARLLPGIL